MPPIETERILIYHSENTLEISIPTVALLELLPLLTELVKATRKDF